MEYMHIVLKSGSIVPNKPEWIVDRLRKKWDIVCSEWPSELTTNALPVYDDDIKSDSICAVFTSMPIGGCSECRLSGALNHMCDKKSSPFRVWVECPDTKNIKAVRDAVYKVTVDDVRKAMEAQYNENI